MKADTRTRIIKALHADFKIAEAKALKSRFILENEFTEIDEKAALKIDILEAECARAAIDDFMTESLTWRIV